VSALGTDATNVDGPRDPVIPGDGWIPLHCFVSSCEANQLVSCSPAGIPKLPEGWISVTIIVPQSEGPREWFACPEHIDESQQSLRSA